MIFKDVSTSENISDLQYFRIEVIECINGLMESGENILVDSMKNEIRKIDNRIEYLEQKNVWDIV